MARTLEAGLFDPDTFISRWSKGELQPPDDRDLGSTIKEAFKLKPNDNYVYHAVASVSLEDMRRYLSAGDVGMLQAWYFEEDNDGNEKKRIPPPSRADIDAYTAIFASATSTPKALTALEKNAKKDSIRSRVAQNLTSKRQFPAKITIPKLKTPHVNPYLDLFNWSCHTIGWAGPEPGTVQIKHSHPILPIFYHHFGCVCPTFEALETIRILAENRTIIDLGSGNGYWTYMLRRMKLSVIAIDNGDSLWRTMWIGDTLKTDAVKYLEKNGGCRNAVLLMVYPQVTTEFTVKSLMGFQGNTLVVAGTQCANGYTAFQNVLVDEWLKDKRPEFEKVVQTPLPSFAGKDEALYVFQRER